MPVISTTKMTARQFDKLGEDPPGIRLELVDGEIAVSPSPRPRHSHAQIALSHLLFDHVKKRDLGLVLGDVDTIFGDFDVRRPDLIFFKKSRVHLVKPDKAINGAPDLCVEIVSPSSGIIDRDDKFIQYSDAGVHHYWIIDPQQESAEAFELRNGSYRMVGSGTANETVTLPPFRRLNISLGNLWLPKK